jgi:hypothetical protein
MRDNTGSVSKSKRILTVLLIAANLLMLTAGIITIPPNLRRVAGKTVQKKEMSKNGMPVPSDTADKGGENQIPKDTTIPAENLDPSDENQTPKASLSVDLSTTKRPDLGDFLWYTEDVFYDGVPADIAVIDDFNNLIGGWKGLIIYDPDNITGDNAMEFLNANIEGTENNLSLTLDWYLMFIAGEGSGFDETDMEDSVFNGKWENGGLWASGPGTIYLTKFYELDNKQYAVGTIDTPDGIPAFIALVRP